MIIYIKQVGATIKYRGKTFRTPIKLDITKSDVDRMKRVLFAKSITNYIVEENEEAQLDNFRSSNNNKKIENLESCSVEPKIVDNDIQTSLNIRRVTKSVSFEKYNQQIKSQNDDMYHDSIENVDSILLSDDSEDILGQLLANI